MARFWVALNKAQDMPANMPLKNPLISMISMDGTRSALGIAHGKRVMLHHTSPELRQ
jgi:hypothetical protein